MQDSEQSHQHRNFTLSLETTCFMNQETDISDAYDADLPSISEESNEDISFRGENIDRVNNDPDDAKKRKGNDKLGQHTAKESEKKKCTLSQNKIEDEDQKRDFVGQECGKPLEHDVMPHQQSVEKSNFTRVMDEAYDTKVDAQLSEEEHENKEHNGSPKKLGKYFYYDSPLYEETGVWIPVSVPPLSKSEHEQWARGFHSSVSFFPEEDFDWAQCNEEDKELTMWDVVAEMLYAARGKVASLATGDIGRISWLSTHLMEQAWKEMAETLTEASFNNTIEIVEADPPKWLPDSAASSCMLCGVRFHPIMCTRHHCRFCGGIFCNDCSRGRSLLPAKFNTCDPERVCDVCCVRLESVQPYLMDRVSRAAQLPTHDVMDLSTLRSWLNFPWGQSMEDEIYKATNTLRGYIEKVLSMRTEKAIPHAILRQAKGLAIITVMKVGMMVTYNIGTGIVIARKDDCSWSAPSAISTFGVGWGAQAGGEVIDLIIVLRTNDAVKTFSGDVHLSLGAGLGAAVGIVGRTAEGCVRAGVGGCAACYTYSCSKGAFVGCSLEGSIVTTRTRENSRFYGSQSLNASEILLGTLPRPPAAATLYRVIEELYQKFERR